MKGVPDRRVIFRTFAKILTTTLENKLAAINGSSLLGDQLVPVTPKRVTKTCTQKKPPGCCFPKDFSSLSGRSDPIRSHPIRSGDLLLSINMIGNGKGHREGRRLTMLRKARVGLPAVVSSCALFFLAGFYGSVLFQGGVVAPSEEPTTTTVLERRWLETDVSSESVPRGKTGEEVATNVSFQVLSWRPRALYFPRFATAAQCESVIKMARPDLTPSGVELRKGETREETKDIRTSSGVFIDAQDDPTGLLNQIEEKIARVTMFPKENGEPFNVLRYQIGQKYSSHYDVFDPAVFGPQRYQRSASFLLYLSDVEEGGETMFPYENGFNMDGKYDYEECIGLKVKPHRGDGLLFYSLTTNGTVDLHSLHGSCPVIKGEKWVATKWLTTTKV